MDSQQPVARSMKLGGHQRAEHSTPVTPLQQCVLNGVRPATLVLGALYLLFAVGHQALGATIAQVMVPVALVTAALFFLMRLVIARWSGAAEHVHVLTLTSVLLVFGNSWLHLMLTQEPLQTTNLLLLVVGSGFLLCSPWIMGGVVGMSLVGWSVVAWSAGGGPAWRHFGFALLSATGLGVLIYLTRQRSLRRMNRLHERDRARASMLESHAVRLETLFAVGRKIHSYLDPEALLSQIVDDLRERFDYDFVSIFLVDATEEHLVARAGTGEAGRYLVESGPRLKIGRDGLIGWATRNRESVMVNDVTRDDRYLYVDILPDTRSEMVIPIQSGNDLVGVLDIQSNELDAFDDEDRSTLSLLADQLGTALQNASRYEVERARRRLTERLYEVGRALSTTLDLREILDLILESLADIVEYDRGSVMLERENMLEFVAARGYPEESRPLAIRVSIKEEDVFQTLRQTHEPLVLPEVLERDDWQHVESLPPARSWVGLPLVNADDEVIGMVSLARETPNPFSEDEVAAGATFAGQAAIALQNARLYQELSEAYRRLAQLDRAKSNFIALASHELRTPLTLMLGYSEMLLNEPQVQDNPMFLQMVQALMDGAGRLQEVVERMMDVAEIESEHMKLQFTHLFPLYFFEEMVENFSSALEQRGLEIDVADLSSVPAMEADRVAMRKVFHHLISNAIKFTPTGGCLSISGRTVPSGYHGVDGPGVELVVSDTGIGIDPSYHEQVFDKFFQTGEVTLHSSGAVKFKGGGPGLGLAIVRGIVEAHHGEVWVESPGYDELACPGTEVHVVLPQRQPESDVPDPSLHVS